MKLDSKKRLSGILEPVFAIRTEKDIGIGDTGGMYEMIDWCHRHSLNIFQVLPINETGDDNCPYMAISAMALDPTTIATSPEHLPDLTEEAFIYIAKPSILKKLREKDRVDYPQVKALKQKLLKASFKFFISQHYDSASSLRAKDFRSFMKEHGEWIHDYAMFRVLMGIHNGWPLWTTWPEEHQNPNRANAWLTSLPSKEKKTYGQEILFYSYVQWIAYRQWEEVKKYATEKKVHLMGDIPIGVGRFSSDVWANRSIFDLDWCGGAPPEKVFKADPFTEKWGQNWGIPLYRWDVLKKRNYDWWRMRVGNIQKIFHIFRIDHVLGFFRIYSFPWSPDRNDFFLPLSEEEAKKETAGNLPHFKPFADDSDEHKEANHKQGEELLKIVIDAAGDTTLVGEDLGMVPDYVVPTLKKLGIPGFEIPAFLRNNEGLYSSPDTYRELSVAAPATHDLMPLALAWKDFWNTIDKNESKDAVSKALHEVKSILSYAGLDTESPPREYTNEIHEAYMRSVMKSKSWMVIYMITDIFSQTGRFNVPGTVNNDNWSHRMKQTVKGLDENPDMLKKTKFYSQLAKENQRTLS